MAGRKRSGKVLVFILAGVVLAGILYQAGATVYHAVEPAGQVWRSIGKSGLWRGVNFSGGQEFANYIEYLEQVLPHDARVILPPAGIGPPALSRTPYMQFFLAPRQVANCTQEGTGALPDEDCARQASQTGAYVLVVQKEDYPASLVTDPARLHLYDQNLGVYFPEGAVFEQGPASGNNSLIQIAGKLIWPGLWLLVLSGAGFSLVTWLAPDWRSAGRAALGFGLGLGGLTLLLYLASLLGLRLSRQLLFGVSLIWAGAGALAFWAQLRARPSAATAVEASASQVKPRLEWPVLFYLLGFAFLAGLAALLAVGMGYHWGDEVILWGVKGYGIASLGLAPGVSEWGTRTTSYPLNLPLLIAAFRIAFGDGLPESKILFPFFYFSLLLLVFDFLQDQFPNRRGIHLAGWLTLGYAATPLIFSHASWAYANLPLAFYLTAGVIAAGRALARFERGAAAAGQQSKGFLLSGIFFMLAAWTRPEGLALSVLAVTCAGGYAVRRVGKGQRLVTLFALAGPLAGYVLVWWGTSGMVYQQGGWSDRTMRAGLAQILSGKINLDNSLFVLRSFLAGFVSFQTWGLFGLSLVGLILFLPFLYRRRKSINLLIVTGLGMVAAILGLYLLLANDPASNPSWWVDTGLDRMLLPGLSLLWLGLLGWLGEWINEAVL